LEELTGRDVILFISWGEGKFKGYISPRFQEVASNGDFIASLRKASEKELQEVNTEGDDDEETDSSISDSCGEE